MAHPNMIDRMAKLHSITPSELKLAAMLERDTAQLAFMTLAELSTKADVGKTTVTRFLQKLGYKNFPDFIRAMRTETLGFLEASPIAGYERDKDRQSASPSSNVLAYLASVSRGIERTMELNTKEQIEKALALLGDTKRPIYIAGAATAHTLALYAFLRLRYIRDKVFLLDGDISTLAHKLSGCADNAVLLAISFHRFSRSTISLMELFHETDKPVIFLSDRFINPFVQHSDVHLVALTEGGEHTLFASRTTAMALIEAIVVGISPSMNEAVKKRFATMEVIFDKLQVFNS